MAQNKVDHFQAQLLIGKTIKILSTSNKYTKNKGGEVVNETKNMIYIKQEKNYSSLLKISKKEIGMYKINLSDKDYFINGKALLGRPEEKISKL